MTMNRIARKRPAPAALSAGAGIIAIVGCGTLFGDLRKEDLQFADYLIYDLGYYETAGRYLDHLKKAHPRPQDQAELAYKEVDILQRQGKTQEYLRRLSEIQKLYPGHARSSIADLPRINVEMGRVIQLFDSANEKSDPRQAADLRAQARKAFQEKVQEPLETLIGDLEKKVAELEKRHSEERRSNPRAPEPQELTDLVRNRNLAELARVKISRIYAEELPAGDSALAETFKQERQKVLEEGVRRAGAFVDDRSEFPLMRFEAQLEKGRLNLELGNNAAAIDDLTVLVDIGRGFGRPAGGFPRELVMKFKEIHLQAILFASKAMNLARRYDEAVRLVQEMMLRPSGDDFDLSQADQDPVLQKYFVLARLEQAVALAGAGSPERGLGTVQGLIDRFTAEQDISPVARAYITDARKALGRIAGLGGVTLRGRDYYQGALGLYAQLQFEQALLLLQFGLTTLSDPAEIREAAPLCLEKIGEINFLLQRPAEAAIAYLEICKKFPQSQQAAKAATNALAAARKLTSASPNHAGYKRLEAEATRYYDQLGKGVAGLEAEMGDAQRHEQQGNFGKAREGYLKIPREHNGEKVPLYWRAQVSALNCLYQMWRGRETEQRKELIKSIQEVAAELEKKLDEARKESAEDALVMGSYILGQIHADLAEWDPAEWGKVEDALRPFLAEYKEDKAYRSAGLFYLTDALLNQKKVGEAEKVFADLRRDFPDTPAALYAVTRLMNQLRAIGTEEASRKAAELVPFYSRHPLVKEEMKDVQRVLELVDVLVEGGQIAEADKLLRQAEGLAGGANGNIGDALEKRLLFRRAGIAFVQGKYQEVVGALREYITKYQPTGGGPDDPYIYQRLGEAFVRRQNPPDVESVKNASDFYGIAINWIDQRRRQDSTGKAEREYWQWAYRWCQLQQFLGEQAKGNLDPWKFIYIWINDREGSEMGGLKDRFLELKKTAEGKLPLKAK